MNPPMPLRLLRASLPYWLPAVLMGSMAVVLAYSVDQANWVRADGLIVSSILWGLLIGFLLAATRFPGWLVAFYSLDLGILVILLSMANIFALFDPFTRHPSADLLADMNLRVFTLLQRLGGWYNALQAGNPLDDTGFFLFLACLTGWCAAIWLVWRAQKKRQGMAAILPFALLLGVNNHLSQQGNGMFWVFLMLAVPLLVYVTYQRNARDWDARAVDYPDSLGMDWGFSAFALTMLVSLVTLFVTTFATPSGWETLARIARDLRKESEPAAQQLFGGVTPPQFVPSPSYARSPDLSDFSRGLPQGNGVVMWVNTNDPAPLPPESSAAGALNIPRHYWRSNVYSVYTPTGWKAVGSFDASPPQPESLDPPQGRYLLRQEFDILSQHDEILFAANQPVQAMNGTAIQYRTLDETALLTGSVSQYSVSSWVTHVSASDLRAVTEQPSEPVLSIYLQVPETLPDRVSQLAARIVAGSETQLDKAMRIQEYLRATYAYATDVEPAAAGADFVDHFLFESQTGYCTHFASAMAVMLRTQGIPARVASGFATGEYDFDHAAYRVIESNAHAWVEVYFAGYGWVEFEPTPSMAPFEMALRQPETVNAPAAPAPVEAQTAAEPRRIWPWIVSAFVLLAALGGVGWWLLGARTAQSSGPSGALYWRMRRMMSLAGLNAGASSTPGEFLDRHQNALAGRLGLLRAAQEVTYLYLQAAFSRTPPPTADIQHARQALRLARAEWLRLIFQRWMVALRRRNR
ncbi:MAG TPA: transglutaminase domain-containing protein [Anaerolineaceae bacterium]